jgi:hypothetical protein
MNSTSTTTPELERLPRLASFTGHLLLDGHGPDVRTSHERRDIHPYFGTWPYNIGDHFVSLAIAKALRFDEFYTINPSAPAAEFDVINSECDFFIIRGSNFVYPGFFAKCFSVGLLRKIKIPIIYIGAGLQFKLGERPHLLPEDYESLRYIHGSCASCSVRGPLTAELLNDGGIQNVRVTGCPTIIWSGRPTIRVRKPSWADVGWTLMDMKAQLAERQFALMEQVRSRSGSFTAFPQGGEVVLQEYILCRDGHVCDARNEEIVSRTLQRFTRTTKSLSKLADTVRYYYRHATPEIREVLLERAFFSNRVSDYLTRLRSLSFVCGTRLHGNIMALCQGTPTLFAVHDERLRDMTELLQAPTVDLSQEEEVIEIAACNWTPFEAAYRRIYASFLAFFEENGLSHQLTESAAMGDGTLQESLAHAGR